MNTVYLMILGVLLVTIFLEVISLEAAKFEIRMRMLAAITRLSCAFLSFVIWSMIFMILTERGTKVGWKYIYLMRATTAKLNQFSWDHCRW